VIEKVQDYFDTNFELGEEVQASLTKLLSVKSHVFTIYFEARVRDGRSSGGSFSFDRAEREPPVATWRAVVWRRQEGEKYTVLPIVPLAPWGGVLPPDDEAFRKQFPFGF
jgi:hypothetical protein